MLYVQSKNKEEEEQEEASCTNVTHTSSFRLRVCFICTNLFDCSGSVQPHPVLNFRGLQHESVRHIHAQHPHYFRKTPFFKTKHRLGAALILSARCVCKPQSSLVFHVTVCTGDWLCLPIGCWPYRERVSALWLVESFWNSTLVAVTELVSAIWLVESLLPWATYCTFPGKFTI